MNGSADGGANIFQIQCMNCHNSGPNNGFGGIHGSKINTYTDANGTTQKPRRFFPGLGNVGWVPGDKNLNPALTEEQKWEQEATSAKGQAGCYTLSTNAQSSNRNLGKPVTVEAGGDGTTAGGNSLNHADSGKLYGTWGSCGEHHYSGDGAKTDRTGDAIERTIVRPVTY